MDVIGKRSGRDDVCPSALHRIITCLIESPFVTYFSRDVFRVRFAL